jgi:hypothetical protein
MTLQEMIIAVYEEMGEPSDLSPYQAGTTVFDVTTAGAVKIRGWINRAYKRILNWKFPNGQQVRFPSQSGEIYFKSMVRSGTIYSSTSTTATLDSGVDANADQYNGCVLSIDSGTGAGQDRLIVDFDIARVATVNRAWDVNPDGTSTYTVYRRRYYFRDPLAPDASENIQASPVSSIAAPLKLIDVTNKSEIDMVDRTEGFATDMETHGDPSGYLWKGNAIEFDVAVDDSDIWFLLEYSRIPPDMALAADEPEMPVSFHEPLVLYACWIGLRRSQEWGGASMTSKSITELMSSVKTGLEMAFERNDIHVEVEP